MGGWKKRRPLCNGVDRGCAHGQHHPTRKRADVRLVLHHQRPWPTSQGEKADDGSGDIDWCTLRPLHGPEAPSAYGEGCVIARCSPGHDRVPQGALARLELLEGKLCAAGRGAESLAQSRGVRRETPGSSTHLTAKARGDKSMSEKREAREGVYRVVLRDPCDKVRAGLPKPQSPAVELHTRRDHARLRRYHERAVQVSRCVLFA